MRSAAYGLSLYPKRRERLLTHAYSRFAVRTDLRLALRFALWARRALLSSILTSMPAMAYLPSMLVELAVYGLITGLMMQLVHTRNIYADLYVSLIIAMAAGKIVAGITRALIFSAGEYSIAAWTTGYFITAWPGILIQLALIPTIVFALEKAKLISVRYPKRP